MDILNIILLIDCSDGMYLNQVNTIKSLNNIINHLKKQTQQTQLSLLTFNDQIQLIFNKININEVRELDEYDYSIGGDSDIYEAIYTVMISYKKIQNVLFIIVADDMGIKDYTDDMESVSTPNIIKLFINENKMNWWYMIITSDLYTFDKMNNLVKNNEPVSNCIYRSHDKLTDAIYNICVDVIDNLQINSIFKKYDSGLPKHDNFNSNNILNSENHLSGFDLIKKDEFLLTDSVELIESEMHKNNHNLKMAYNDLITYLDSLK